MPCSVREPRLSHLQQGNSAGRPLGLDDGMVHTNKYSSNHQFREADVVVSFAVSMDGSRLLPVRFSLTDTGVDLNRAVNYHITAR